MRYFRSQRNKHWFSEDLFYGLMRLRAVEIALPTKHAEAFYCQKISLAGIGPPPPPANVGRVIGNERFASLVG
jgi:hypothetical protein